MSMPGAWREIRLAYFLSRRRVTLQDLARTHGLPYRDVLRVAKVERWRQERMSIELLRAARRRVPVPACLAAYVPKEPPALPSNVVSLAAWRARRASRPVERPRPGGGAA